MAESTRIKGRQLSILLGTPPVDYWCDSTKVTLENEEADEGTVTFCNAAEPGGARQEFLSITAIQSTDEDSMWSYLWDHAGEDVPFTYAPHGNAAPSVSQPHFVGTATLGARPTIGGEAGRTNTYTFETRWDIVGTVTKVTTGV